MGNTQTASAEQATPNTDAAASEDRSISTQATTLEKLRRTEPMTLPADQIAGFSNAGAFELLQRGARMLATSTLVPDAYKGNLSNCAIALELAQRLGASPLMICQSLYIVYGRPSWSSQFLIACVNQCGRYSALRYEWVGKPGHDDWGCRAWAIDLATKERVQGPLVTIAMAKAEGWYNRKSGKGDAASKWPTMPELMLTYRAATFFARTNAPELTMGLPTREEREDVIDLEQVSQGTYSLAELQAGQASAAVVTAAGAVDPSTGEIVREAAPEPTPAASTSAPFAF